MSAQQASSVHIRVVRLAKRVMPVLNVPRDAAALSVCIAINGKTNGNTTAHSEQYTA